MNKLVDGSGDAPQGEVRILVSKLTSLVQFLKQDVVNLRESLDPVISSFEIAERETKCDAVAKQCTPGTALGVALADIINEIDTIQLIVKNTIRDVDL